ncbi:hypothetical protein N4G69_47130 [Streptomyces mirabilis]|uniref:hypothetical protein n=1 Tax=Streptomyces mirabilis TaxID=68239 RepID=UPI0021C12D69|nr:hypothetical protein [Streptomyces mirabilis]MCT9113016.1 hypothetical protein [Streptomyces mirabilis]
MTPPVLRLVLLLLALAVTTLFGLFTAGLAALLARHTGASTASALLRAGAAFAATATLALAVLTLAATAL